MAATTKAWLAMDDWRILGFRRNVAWRPKSGVKLTGWGCVGDLGRKPSKNRSKNGWKAVGLKSGRVAGSAIQVAAS